MENELELIDLLESMENKIEASAFILNMRGKDKWVHSILECVHEDSQKVIDGWCVNESTMLQMQTRDGLGRKGLA